MKSLNMFPWQLSTDLSNTVLMLHSVDVSKMGKTNKEPLIPTWSIHALFQGS